MRRSRIRSLLLASAVTLIVAGCAGNTDYCPVLEVRVNGVCTPIPDDATAADHHAISLDASPIDAQPDLAAIPFDGAVCGANRFDVRVAAPNVLILLDRSCSMQQTPSGAAATEASGLSKWSIAVRTLAHLTATYATQVRWGLIYLPREGTAASGVSCMGSPVCGGTTTCPEVSPGPATGPLVDAITAGISPYNGCRTGAQVAITPIYSGLVAAGDVAALHDAARNDFVMLITDGEETCVPMTRLVSEVSALHTANIRTAVVGFGAAGTGGINPTELNAMAAAGGVPATGPTQYYAATDEASLASVFTALAGTALSCTFALGAAASDPTRLHVFVNATTELTRDSSHMMGWDYDPSTHSVMLYGMACDDVRALRDSQLDVIEGCPGQTMIPPPPIPCHHNGGSCVTNTDCCNLEGLSCDTIQGVCIPTPG